MDKVEKVATWSNVTGQVTHNGGKNPDPSIPTTRVIPPANAS